MKKRALGWFGVPGAPAYRSSKTHVVDYETRKVICGARLHKLAEFQFCCFVDEDGSSHYAPECDHCARVLLKETIDRRDALAKLTRRERRLLGLDNDQRT